MEKDKRITKYESELHLQTQQEKNGIISALEKELFVQREEARDDAVKQVRFCYMQSKFRSLYCHKILTSQINSKAMVYHLSQ
jgi:hypothetical protein